MRSKFISLFAVIGAAVVLVLAANTVALATTGKALIAGKSNTSSKVTTIKRTKPGPAVKLTTKNTSDAPLAVNGGGKVTNLNADKVDGLDSTALVNNARTYTIPARSATGAFEITLPGLPPGLYLATFAATFGVAAGSTGANCGFEQGLTTKLLSYGARSDNFSAVSGAGVLDTRSTVATFRCFTFAGTINPESGAQISLTRLNAVTAGGAPVTVPRTLPRTGAAR